MGEGSNELVALGVAYFGLGLFINGPKTLSGIALRQVGATGPAISREM